MTETMLCICGHSLTKHMNKLKCCLVCGCAHTIPALTEDVAHEFTYDEDVYRTNDEDSTTQ